MKLQIRLAGFKLCSLLLIPASLLLLGATSTGAKERLTKFAGTALSIAALNYAGPYGALVAGALAAYNGTQVDPVQSTPSAQTDYEDIYKDSITVDPYGGESASGHALDETGISNPLSPTINASLVHAGPGGEMELLENGATLRGPRADYSGDRVGVVFSPENTSYVYVVAVDGTGWAQTLFPDPVLDHNNPVSAGSEILLPGDTLYGLDNVPGVETIYILSSNRPRPDLEAKLQPFLGKERPPAMAGSSYRSVERPIIISRGLTGVRPGTSAYATNVQPASMKASLPLNTFVAADGENEIALTLWFNHK